MAQLTGSKTKLVLLEESSYRTLPATPAGHVIGRTSSGLSKSRNRIDSNMLADTRMRIEPLRGNVDVSGDISVEVNAGSMPMLLKHLMGTVATSGAGPYTHSFDIGNLPSGLTLELDYGPDLTTDRYVQFEGCRIASAQFSFPTEGPCTATFNVSGAEATLANAPLDASPATYDDTPFSAFDATIKEGATLTTLGNCREVSFTYDNGLDTDSGYVIGGGGTRNGLPEGFVTLTGQIVTLFEDTTLLNKALSSTETALEITLSRGTGDGSSGNEKIVFSITRLKFDPQTPPVEGPQGLLVTLPFSAYKVGADQGFAVSVFNSVVAY